DGVKLFVQVAVQQGWGTQAGPVRDVRGHPFHLPILCQSARSQTVQSIAQATYEAGELEAGHLSAERLSVLADAMEEAGCTDDALLAHLRSPGPHVRGCWALDLILGKS